MLYFHVFFSSCWLRYDTHFVWAFITPVIVIILVRMPGFCMYLGYWASRGGGRGGAVKYASIM